MSVTHNTSKEITLLTIGFRLVHIASFMAKVVVDLDRLNTAQILTVIIIENTFCSSSFNECEK